jgi:hypothetical protein
MKAWCGIGLIVMALAGCQPSAGSAGVIRDEERAAEQAMRADSGAQTGSCLGEGQGSSSYEEQQATGRGESSPSCCSGLTRLDAYESAARPGQCLVSKGGRFVCARCGDGECREGENPCNCPTDCK